MRHLVWHWGRRGAGPLFAARLAEALGTLDGQSVVLSLAERAEILSSATPPPCAWREPTYETGLGYLARRVSAPLRQREVLARLAACAPDIAICAMPSLLDRTMLTALSARKVPLAVIVHDAQAHLGESFRFRLLGQERLLAAADHLFCLSGHVEQGLRARGFGRGRQTLTRLWHPYMGFGLPLAGSPPSSRPGGREAGRPRLLHFGRLQPYKGLDLLADALDRIGQDLPFELRICGEGAQSPTLARLQRRKDVRVEARWFAEGELPGLFDWADALVLPYREASQSGVAAMGLAAGRHILATAVGGLPEQLAGVKAARLCPPTAPAIAEAILDLVARLETGQATATVIPDWRQSWTDLAATMLGVLQARPAPVLSGDAALASAQGLWPAQGVF